MNTSPTQVTIVSIIISSIMASVGIAYNDTYLILASVIFSPVGGILNKLSKNIATGNMSKSVKNTSLLILTILCAIIMIIKIMFNLFF